jgi:YCII-related domain
MPNYAFSYISGSSPNDAQGGDQKKFGAWIGSLGDAIVNPGTPLGMPKIVSSNGVTDGKESGRSTGFSIIKADSMDAAVEMAKSCPFLDIGTVEVAEVFTM